MKALLALCLASVVPLAMAAVTVTTGGSGGMDGLVSLMVTLIVAGLIFWLLLWLIGFAGLPEPFAKVAKIILAVVAVIFIINLLLGMTSSGPIFRFR